MSESSSDTRDGVNWTLVGVIAVGIGLSIAYVLSPEDSTLRKLVAEAPSHVTVVPDRAKRMKSQWRDRLEQAKATFRGARAESESALLQQLKEAKQRGSVGPT